MVTFKDLLLKNSYETKKDDLIADFYIPTLNLSWRYDRISGYFSSSSLAIAARGLYGLIKNGGKMRLVMCPRLSKEDAAIIETSVDPSATERILDINLDEIVDSFERDHVAALGWMLSKGLLEIKIAVVTAYSEDEYKRQMDSIMHQKVGIMYDMENNALSFSGSNNESASGWLENIEEFKVFREWEDGQRSYFESDMAKFREFWNDSREGVFVRNLPDSVKEKLIQISSDFDVENLALEHYYKKTRKPELEVREKIIHKRKLKPFSYQQEAIEKWESNGRRLLFQMCTGSGKTITALGCMERVLKEGPALVVIACPQSTLSSQWMTVVNSLDIPVGTMMMCDSSLPTNWRKVLNRNVSALEAEMINSLVVFTTHATCSKEDFCEVIESVVGIKKMLIGDEVHGMGSTDHSKGLLECYDFRVGLSATPSRWFDESGTQLIEDYFGNDSYVFDLAKALYESNPLTNKPFLVNFNYHPEFISLTEDELEEYRELSEKIRKMSGSSNEDIRRALEFLLFRRANLEKSAENKYKKLEEILDRIEREDKIADLIIFVSEEQIGRVMEMLGKRGIVAHKFTQEEGTTKMAKYGNLSERDYLIKLFARGEYQVLVAIKCLDEGIDIPSASKAIIMASSTNPREYVQRIGRIIRQADGKENADIYDMIIRPNLSDVSEEFRKLENRIFRKEMERVKDLSANALNNSKVLGKVYDIIGGIQ